MIDPLPHPENRSSRHQPSKPSLRSFASCLCRENEPPRVDWVESQNQTSGLLPPFAFQFHVQHARTSVALGQYLKHDIFYYNFCFHHFFERKSCVNSMSCLSYMFQHHSIPLTHSHTNQCTFKNPHESTSTLDQGRRRTSCDCLRCCCSKIDIVSSNSPSRDVCVDRSHLGLNHGIECIVHPNTTQTVTKTLQLLVSK